MGAAGLGSSANPDAGSAGNATFLQDKGTWSIGDKGMWCGPFRPDPYIDPKELGLPISEQGKPGMGTSKAPVGAPPAAVDQASIADQRMAGMWAAQRFHGMAPGRQTGSLSVDDYRNARLPLPAKPGVGGIGGPAGFGNGDPHFTIIDPRLPNGGGGGVLLGNPGLGDFVRDTWNKITGGGDGGNSIERVGLETEDGGSGGGGNGNAGKPFLERLGDFCHAVYDYATGGDSDTPLSENELRDRAENISGVYVTFAMPGVKPFSDTLDWLLNAGSQIKNAVYNTPVVGPVFAAANAPGDMLLELGGWVNSNIQNVVDAGGSWAFGNGNWTAVRRYANYDNKYVVGTETLFTLAMGGAGAYRAGGRITTGAALKGEVSASRNASVLRFPSNLNELVQTVKAAGKRVKDRGNGTFELYLDDENSLRFRVDTVGHEPDPIGPNGPRHLNPHVHAEQKLSNNSWTNKKKVTVTARPPNYIPGHPSGFLPGEAIPEPWANAYGKLKNNKL